MGRRFDAVSESAIAAATRLYKAFHDRAPSKGALKTIALDRPETVLEVGWFFGIIYISEGQKYLHKFNANNRPLVFVSADGRQIYILKGGYKFTDRGFIG